MNYIMHCDYDNYDEIFEAMLALKHGTCFNVLNYNIRFYQLGEQWGLTLLRKKTF